MSCEQSCLDNTCCSLKPKIPAREMYFWVAAAAGREVTVAWNSHREDEVRWLSVQVSSLPAAVEAATLHCKLRAPYCTTHRLWLFGLQFRELWKWVE